MKRKKTMVPNIIKALGDLVLDTQGIEENAWIDNLADKEHVTKTTLDWVKPSNKKKQTIVEESIARVFIVDEGVVYSTSIKSQSKALIYVNNPRNAIAIIAQTFFSERDVPIGIHPTAIIDKEAIIEEDVSIGAFCVIGKVHIGKGTQINNNVTIHDSTIIGSHCFIDTGAVLGGPGFGYEKDEKGNLFRFPQIGGLLIGDHVDIGANTCIDRGALSDTVIGSYTKIDNLCHIAHNNKIGRNCIITAGTVISGSNVIGDNVWFSPNSSIKDWCKIDSNSMIGIGSVVVRKVKEGGKVFGNPATEIVF